MAVEDGEFKSTTCRKEPQDLTDFAAKVNRKRNEDYDKLRDAAPKWLWFLDEYVVDNKPRILALDPNDRKIKRRARHLLMELLFAAIDAAADDINDACQKQKKPHARFGNDDDPVDSVLGDMSEDENESTKKTRALGQIVKAEMEVLAEAAKEAIEDMM